MGLSLDQQTRASSVAIAIGLALAAQPARAQTVTPSVGPAPAGDAAPPAATDDAQTIVVTGSRISRREFNAPNPITTFSAAAITQSGNTNLTDFLVRVPALANSLDASRTAGYTSVARQPFGGAGLNELDLRGLGTNRTLVLVNGRRHVAGEQNVAAVDINSIPTDLVERVDTLTGGASAIYGADGVSGVVNFILKRNVEGVSARAQLGISGQGDAGNQFVSVIAGHNFGGGRGNVTLAYEYSANDALRNDDRAYLRQDRRQYIVQNILDPNDDPRLPDNVLVGDLRYGGESINGAVYGAASGNLIADGNGQPYVPGIPVSFYAIGGSSTPVAGFVGDLLPKTERHAVNLLSHYDFSDAFKLSVEAKFVESRAQTFDQFTGDYPSFVAGDNPFIPAAIRAAATPADLAAGFNIVRDNVDYGRHGEADRRRTYRGVIALNGRLTPHASYDLSYTYGRTQMRVTKINDRLADRYLAALDVVTNPATGLPVCRSTQTPAAAAGAVTFTPGATSGCAPLNIFGTGSPSRAALNFFQLTHASSAAITQSVVSGSVSGDFGALFALPGGPVGFAFGGEYRRETSRFDPNSYLQQALFYQFDEPGNVPPSRGSFNVKEAFAELNAPLLRNVPFAETLALGAAIRYAHYSTTGDATSWSVNGVYAPVRDISFRGSYGKAVRAPNIGELYLPASASSTFLSDPCDPTQINTGTSSRVANCRAILTGLGVDPASFSPGTAGSTVAIVAGAVAGNRNLTPETAKTLTAGVVLRPRFVPGLTLSLDYYDIKLAGAINVADPQTLAQLCVDQPTIANQFCANITRAPKTGYIISYLVQPQNVAQFRVSGVDLNLAYRLRTASAGTFDVALVGGYVQRATFVSLPGAAVEDKVDQNGTLNGQPRWQATFNPTWTLGSLSVAYTLRWQDKQRRFARAITDAQPDYAPANLLRIKSLWQHDVQLRYRVDDAFAVYAGVTNLGDQKPDVDATNRPISPLGRFLYVGASIAVK